MPGQAPGTKTFSVDWSHEFVLFSSGTRESLPAGRVLGQPRGRPKNRTVMDFWSLLFPVESSKSFFFHLFCASVSHVGLLCGSDSEREAPASAGVLAATSGVVCKVGGLLPT